MTETNGLRRQLHDDLNDLRPHIGNGGIFRAMIRHRGFSLLALFRLRTWTQARHLGLARPILNRVMEHRFGASFAPGVVLGRGTYFPHCTGITIGRDVRIGDGVTICQNVTIGGSEGRVRDGRQTPIVHDGVRLAPGSSIIGPVEIGRDSLIGAGVVVTRDVPEGALVKSAPIVILERSNGGHLRAPEGTL